MTLALDATIAGLGALLLGLGSALSGYAALYTARHKDDKSNSDRSDKPPVGGGIGVSSEQGDQRGERSPGQD